MRYDNDDIFGAKRRLKGSLMMLPFLILVGVIIYAYENWDMILQTVKNFLQ